MYKLLRYLQTCSDKTVLAFKSLQTLSTLTFCCRLEEEALSSDKQPISFASFLAFLISNDSGTVSYSKFENHSLHFGQSNKHWCISKYFLMHFLQNLHPQLISFKALSKQPSCKNLFKICLKLTCIKTIKEEFNLKLSLVKVKNVLIS